MGGRFLARLDRLVVVRLVSRYVLLVHGSEDKLAPIDRTAVVLAKAVSTARLERLDGFGHLVEVEAQSRVNELLREFYAEK